jgi:outer membrane lipase/esterase
LTVALICLLGQRTGEAKSTPFSRIIVFGDSLSDTGNLFALTGGFPPPPYSDGRFSNGPLWVEYVAQDLGMDIWPGDNYAMAGATTGHLNVNSAEFGLALPGLQDEIASFLTSIEPGAADPEALYVVWAGANDFFLALATDNPNFLFTDSLPNMLLAIQRLWEAGARHIVLPNVADLGLTPRGQASGNSAGITFLCALYNQALAEALRTLADQGIATIQVNAFATLQAMVNFPDDFGFTNVAGPFLLTGGESDPAEFLFWDPVHPTTRGHEVLAHDTLHAIVDHYSPSNGQASPEARSNALKGLVHAGKP